MNASPTQAIGCLALLTLFLGCGGGSGSTPSVRASLQPILDAERLTLYSIYSTEKTPRSEWPKTEESFHRYPVLRKVDVSDRAARVAIAEALEEGIRKGQHPAKCFDPHHALRAEREGESVDYVICFSCDQIYVYAQGEHHMEVVSEEPRPLLDKYLKAAEEEPGE